VPLALVFVAVAALPGEATGAQPQFGLELEGGATNELHPYVRNEVITSHGSGELNIPPGHFQPFLVDRRASASPSLTLRLVAKSLIGHIRFRWFNLDQQRVHHKGESTIPFDRMRPDGTVDDAGVSYEALDPPANDALPPGADQTLYELGVGGGYRILWPGRAVDFFVPIEGSLVWLRASGSASPMRLGLEAASGGGLSLQLNETIALNLTGKLHGLVTRHYGRSGDAAYRAVEIGESTEAAFFSSHLFATGNMALQFTIR
jgi:hypothetical protein